MKTQTEQKPPLPPKKQTKANNEKSTKPNQPKQQILLAQNSEHLCKQKSSLKLRLQILSTSS